MLCRLCQIAARTMLPLYAAGGIACGVAEAKGLDTVCEQCRMAIHNHAGEDDGLASRIGLFGQPWTPTAVGVGRAIGLAA